MISIFKNAAKIGLVAISTMWGVSANAQTAAPVLLTEVNKATVADAERPQPTPPPTFIDHAVDHAVATVRKLKKKAPSRIPDWVVDGIERAYRVYRNEQELAVWRARARQMIADLALIAETLDAHIENSAEFEKSVNEAQAEFTMRIEALERVTLDHGRRIDDIDRKSGTTAGQVGELVTIVTGLQKAVAKTNTELEKAKAALAAAQRRAATSGPKTVPRAEPERRFPGIPVQMPGDTMTEETRRAIFSRATGQ